MNFNSKSERDVAPIFAAMQVPASPCEDFTEAGLPNTYSDASGVSLEGKPDFVARQPFTVTCIECKDGRLNHHLTHESSRAALQSEYQAYTRRIYTDSLPHSFLSDFLWKTPARRACLDQGWNHSLWKVLALQAEHGWQRYIVVFKTSPSKSDAIRYLKAGLVFCTRKTLPELLRVIELAQHGIFLPFVHEAKRAGYSFTVTADHADLGKSERMVAAADRIKFLTTVAADADRSQPPF